MTGVRFEIAQSQILEAAFVRRPVMIEHRHFSDCGCSRGNLREPPVTRVLAAVSHTARSLSNQQRVG